MFDLRLFLLTIVVVAVCSVAPAQAPVTRATFRGLGDLAGGAFHSEALAVSPDGLAVAGQGALAADEQSAHAFVWTAATDLRAVERLPGGVLRSQPRAIGNDGALVGNLAFAQCPSRAFRWSRSGAVVLDDLDGGDTVGGALDQSGDGKVVVGWGSSAAGLEAVRWIAGKPHALGDVAGGPHHSSAAAVSRDGTIVAGTGTNTRGRLAWRWTEAKGLQELGDLDGGEQDSEPFGISADGLVIVGRGNSARGPEGFRWTAKSGMQPVGDLAGGKFESLAFDVSADGRRVVGTAESELGTEAFVWDDGAGMKSLRALLLAAGVKAVDGWRLTSVNSIADDGVMLVGGGIDPEGRTQAFVAELPRRR
jgi:probable HAF family extracellular repeat protein